MNEEFKNSLKIIDMEDELASISDEIKRIKSTIKSLRKDKKNKIKLNYCLTFTEIAIALIGSFNPIAISATIFYMIAVFIFLKLIDIKTFGTFENIKKEKHKLFIQKEILLADYKDLENKLYKFKLFSEINKENNVEINNNYVEQNTLEKDKFKKLTLTKPNDD